MRSRRVATTPSGVSGWCAIFFSLCLFLLGTQAYLTPLSMISASSSKPSNPSRLRLVTNKKCPFAQKAWIALEYLYAGSKDYDLLEVGLYGGSGKPQWFLDISPKGQVPVLWLPSGRCVVESDNILDHLTSLPGPKLGFPNPLVPASPKAYTHLRSLLNPFLRSARTAIERKDITSLFSSLNQLDKEIIGPCPFLAGATFSAADATLLPFMQRLVDGHAELVEAAAPRLHEWYKGAAREPCFEATCVSGYWMWW